MTKRLWIIAGPNGAGKSTLVSRYNKANLFVLNPDDIAQQLSPTAPEKVGISAGRKATQLRKQLLKDGKSFILETTFSGKGALTLIKAAKSQGYKINLVFVGLKSAALSAHRVSMRVRDGGHSVPISDILRRYPRSGENLRLAIPLVDRAIVLDNTKSKHQPIARLEKGKVKRVSTRLPRWAKEFLPALKKAQDRGL